MPEVTWPETTIFWGAGATAVLGMPLTFDQGKRLRDWGASENTTELELLLSGLTWPDSAKEHILLLLEVLGHGNSNARLAEVEPELLSKLESRLAINEPDARDLVVNLRSDYDWDALRAIMGLLPKSENTGNFLRDLFNLLDMHIHGRLSFNVKGKKDTGRETLSQVRLIGARNCLVMLINAMFQGAFQGLEEGSAEKLKPYIAFAEALGVLMQEEGVRFLDEGHKRDSRSAYLFSYAVVSMNFDPVLLWLIFNAHKRLNHDRAVPNVGSPCQPLRLYNDMGHFMGCRYPKLEDPLRVELWYPFNEAVVQRINDPEYTCGRVARVGKFYFPHGSSCWRECPSCGKLNMFLGDEWTDASPTLFPPLPLQTEFMLEARTELEKKEREEGRRDSLSCGFCGARTSTQHTPMVMQSSFKGQHASFIEEIQRDMRACIENTRHFVLMGYSLPEDDVIYRALLASRKGEGSYCTVVVGRNGPHRWLLGDEIEKIVEDKGDNYQTLQAAIDIFGNDHVRAYTGGIPRVFTIAGEARSSMREILYPNMIGFDCFVNRATVRRNSKVDV